MVFGKLTDFGYFSLDAILSNMPMRTMASFGPCAWKFTDVVFSFYCALYKFTFVSILVSRPLIMHVYCVVL